MGIYLLTSFICAMDTVQYYTTLTFMLYRVEAYV